MKKKWLIIVIAVIVIMGLVAWNMSQPQARLEVIQPHVGTIEVFVEEQAKTELPTDYLVAMPIAGWLEPIGLREGDSVAAGQVVARLDQADLKDRVLQAEQRIAVLETRLKETADHRLEHNALVEANATVKAINETVEAAEKKLEAAKAVADFAQSEVDRIKSIAQQDAAVDRELREAETQRRRTYAEYQSDALELAALKTIAAVSYIGPKFITDYIDRKSFKQETYEKQLAEARAALEMEKRNLARAEITSPADGVVLQCHQTRRQFLPAGTPLLTVGQLDDMEVIAEVLTERATRISPGDRVDIYGEAIADGTITGKVARVYPAGFMKISSLGVEQQRVKVAIRLDHRPEKLGVEYRVHVRIHYDKAIDTLMLPRTALFRSKTGNWQTMTVVDSVTKLRTVTVGLTNDDFAQILEGLTTQDRVVARPSRDIIENMRVETFTPSDL